MIVTIRYWRLEQIERTSNTNKFYEVWLNETEAQTWLSWGRIGTNGQDDLKKFLDAEDAKAKALAQVYAKQAKGYALIHDDLVIEVEDDVWRNRYVLRNHTQNAVRSGAATPREAALNYIEGFVQDCNEFLVKAREGIDPDELQGLYEDIDGRWTELKDKFDSAETMMQMVTMRTLKRA